MNSSLVHSSPPLPMSFKIWLWEISLQWPTDPGAVTQKALKTCSGLVHSDSADCGRVHYHRDFAGLSHTCTFFLYMLLLIILSKYYLTKIIIVILKYDNVHQQCSIMAMVSEQPLLSSASVYSSFLFNTLSFTGTVWISLTNLTMKAAEPCLHFTLHPLPSVISLLWRSQVVEGRGDGENMSI